MSAAPTFPLRAGELQRNIADLTQPGRRTDARFNIAYRAVFVVSDCAERILDRHAPIKLICPRHGPFATSWRNLCHRGAETKKTCGPCDLENHRLRCDRDGLLGSTLQALLLQGDPPWRNESEGDGKPFQLLNRYQNKFRLAVVCLAKPDGVKICGHPATHQINNLIRNTSAPGHLICQGKCKVVERSIKQFERGASVQDELCANGYDWTLTPNSYISAYSPSEYRHICGYIRRSKYAKFKSILEALPGGKTGCPVCDKYVPQRCDWNDVESLNLWVRTLGEGYLLVDRVPNNGSLMLNVQCVRHAEQFMIAAKLFAQLPSHGCFKCENDLRKRPKNRWGETYRAITGRRNIVLESNPDSPRKPVKWHNTVTGQKGFSSVLQICQDFLPTVVFEGYVFDELSRIAAAGLLGADGNMPSRVADGMAVHAQLCLLAEDEDVVIAVSRSVGIQTPKLKYHASSEGGFPGLYVTLDIRDRPLLSFAIESCNLKPNKSKKLQPPVFGDSSSVMAYIAGNFGGDGATPISVKDKSIGLRWCTASIALAQWLQAELAGFISYGAGGYDDELRLGTATAVRIQEQSTKHGPFFQVIVDRGEAKRELAAHLLAHFPFLPQRKRDALGVLKLPPSRATTLKRQSFVKIVGSRVVEPGK